MLSANKYVLVLLVLLLPVLFVLSTFPSKSKHSWSRMFGYGTSWRMREATGLQRYALSAGEAESIIEVGAARFGIGIRFGDAAKGVVAARALKSVFAKSEDGSINSTKGKSGDSYLYTLGKSTARIGLLQSKTTVPIGAVREILSKYSEKNIVVLKVPDYAAVTFRNTKLQPVYSGKRFDYYNLNDVGNQESVTVAADVRQEYNMSQFVYVLIACLIFFAANIYGVFQLGASNASLKQRKSRMDRFFMLPGVLSIAALLYLAISGLLSKRADIFTDLWIQSYLPLPTYNALIPGAILNLCLSFIIVQTVLGNAFKNELLLADSSITNEDKLKSVAVSAEYVVMPFIYLVFFVSMFGSDIFGIYTSRFSCMVAMFLGMILVFRSNDYVSVLRVKLGLVDTEWLENIRELLARHRTKRLRLPNIKLDLGTDGMKKAYINAYYLHPTVVSGKLAQNLSIRELEFLALEKSLQTAKHIRKNIYVYIFFIYIIVFYIVLFSSNTEELVMAYAIVPLGLVVLAFLIEISAVLNSFFPTVARYRKALQMTGDYTAARSALVKFYGRTPSGRLKSHLLSRTYLKCKLNRLAKAHKTL